MFNVRFKNLGTIVEGQVKLNKLTILCGENNTGKTFASYSIYGLLKAFSELSVKIPSLENINFGDLGQFQLSLEDLFDQLDEIIAQKNEDYSANLFRVFSTNQAVFKESKVDAEIDIEALKEAVINIGVHSKTVFKFAKNSFDIEKHRGSLDVTVSHVYSKESDIKPEVFRRIIEERLNDIVFERMKSRIFLLPAERGGINLFYKELNANRNELVHELSINLLNNEEVMLNNFEKNINPYAVPISDYISFLNRLESLASDKGPFQDLALEIQKEVIKGDYNIVDQTIYFIPHVTGKKQKNINLHVSSSTAKTLFGLVFYLNYMAEPGQYLIIDEPELNLHPDNQRKIARILAKISKRGINVIISTHSDYIIKELNNLIMLSNNFKSRKKIMDKYGYTDKEVLKSEDVSPYVFVNGKINLMEIDKLEGIVAETFDTVINQYNNAVDDIFYALREETSCE